MFLVGNEKFSYEIVGRILMCECVGNHIGSWVGCLWLNEIEIMSKLKERTWKSLLLGSDHM
jgi:hypothetical protein